MRFYVVVFRHLHCTTCAVLVASVGLRSYITEHTFINTGDQSPKEFKSSLDKHTIVLVCSIFAAPCHETKFKIFQLYNSN